MTVIEVLAGVTAVVLALQTAGVGTNGSGVTRAIFTVAYIGFFVTSLNRFSNCENTLGLPVTLSGLLMVGVAAVQVEWSTMKFSLFLMLTLLFLSDLLRQLMPERK